MKRKVLPLFLVITLLSLTTACGLKNVDDLTTEREGTMAESREDRDNLSVLDKGGANPTDNVSIIDPEVTFTPSPNNNLGNDSLIDDLGDAASDVMEDTNDGLHNLTSPDPSPSANGLNNGAGNGTGAR